MEWGGKGGGGRRGGWFDAAALRRAIIINGVSGLCITKLDVLDGMQEVKACVGYKFDGGYSELLPSGAEDASLCEPVYESFNGWTESTVGIKKRDALPLNARKYLDRLQVLCDVPIDMISTGPDREETIVQRHPFQ